MLPRRWSMVAPRGGWCISRRSLLRKRQFCLTALALTCIWLAFRNSIQSRGSWVSFADKEWRRSEEGFYRQWGSFFELPFNGFINTGLSGLQTCDELRYNGAVGVQKSIHLDDDLHSVASSLHNHPMVIYEDDMINDPDLSFVDVVNKTWARLSGSSVWLPEQQVFLVVSRIIFTSSGVREWPRMSFLRGQLFDKNWQHLKNRQIVWEDKQFTFPRIFEVPSDYDLEGGFYGPEDPRVIVRNTVAGAEPVIVFNMLSRETDWRRAMYIFRPFSNHSTILTIKGDPRKQSEKNWSPFFPTLGDPGRGQREDEDYIHFVRFHNPLSIIRCHLHFGICENVFQQQTLDISERYPTVGRSILRGGTNYVPLPFSDGQNSSVNAWVGFPRIAVLTRCGERYYRPVLNIVVKAGDSFFLAYTSEITAFGSSVLELSPTDNPCLKGRILLPNSISDWHVEGGSDIMSITVSVDDSTVQVVRIAGLLGLIQNMPPQEWMGNTSHWTKDKSDLYSLTSHEIRACSAESAVNFTLLLPGNNG